MCKQRPNYAGGFAMCNLFCRKTSMSYDKNTEIKKLLEVVKDQSVGVAGKYGIS